MTLPFTISAEERRLVDDTLAVAADTLGDITAPVMEQFYARHPDGKVAFQENTYGHVAETETMMVSSALYCLMDLGDNPNVVKFFLLGQAEHHQSIGVRDDLFWGLMNAMLSVIADSLPAASEEARNLLRKIEAGFAEMLRQDRLPSAY